MLAHSACLLLKGSHTRLNAVQHESANLLEHWGRQRLDPRGDFLQDLARDDESDLLRCDMLHECTQLCSIWCCKKFRKKRLVMLDTCLLI